MRNDGTGSRTEQQRKKRKREHERNWVGGREKDRTEQWGERGSGRRTAGQNEKKRGNEQDRVVETWHKTGTGE